MPSFAAPLARRAAVALGAGALLIPAGAIAVAQASPKATTKVVKLSGMQFSTRSVSIAKGQKVKFVWSGGAHNLVGPGVKTSVMSTGSKTVTFKKAGSFRYVCQVHPGMTMTVKVH